MSQPEQPQHTLKPEPIVFESDSIFDLAAVLDASLKTFKEEGIAEILDQQLSRIAQAITADAAPNQDASGGTVASLTEAIMGVTAGLCRIAEAIHHHAETLQEIETNRQ